MKPTLITTLLFFTLTLLGSSYVLPAQNTHQTLLETKPNMNKKDSKLRHVVLFSFKENTSEKDIQKIEKAFSALPGKIVQIKDYEWGINNSPEGLNDGLTHCFLVTFDSEADRAIYLPHPAHQAFIKILQPHLDHAVVVDYWANEK